MTTLTRALLILAAWVALSIPVGIAVGRLLARQNRALAECREAFPEVFDRGFESGQHLAAFQLAQLGVARQQQGNARWS